MTTAQTVRGPGQGAVIANPLMGSWSGGLGSFYPFWENALLFSSTFRSNLTTLTDMTIKYLEDFLP
jgi:hypothetical protein